MIDRHAERRLLHLARAVLTRYLVQGKTPRLHMEKIPCHLRQPASTFVTLTNEAFRSQPLRGCIGSTHAALPLVEDVRRNSLAAARDPRFSPLQAVELPDLRIQISLLHTPHPLQVDSYEDLLRSLQPGVDGVIISWHDHKGLLLPQVWERLDKPAVFLDALCQKARIPEHVLRNMPADLLVSTFAATTFSEYDWPEARLD